VAELKSSLKMSPVMILTLSVTPASATLRRANWAMSALYSIPTAWVPYWRAAVMAMIPWIAEWTQHAMDTALGAAGTDAASVGNAVLSDAGINYLGAANLGAGAIVVGMILGSMVAFLIDHKFMRAAITSGIAVILTFFGVIHAPSSVGILPNPGMTIGYALVGLLFLGYHFGLFDKLGKKGGETTHA
jgi:hypothetical protein